MMGAARGLHKGRRAQPEFHAPTPAADIEIGRGESVDFDDPRKAAPLAERAHPTDRVTPVLMTWCKNSCLLHAVTALREAVIESEL
jgi:hypothetical protein